MSDNDLQALLRTGIQAVRNGNKPMARRIFEQVLEIDDRNELAWLWMASVVETPRERRICLENVLEINPQNERALEALKKLTEREPEDAARPKAESRRRGRAPAREDEIDLDARLKGGPPPKEEPEWMKVIAETPAPAPEDEIDLEARLGAPALARSAAPREGEIDWSESAWVAEPAPERPAGEKGRREPAREAPAADFGEAPLAVGPPRRRHRRLSRLFILLAGGFAIIAIVLAASLLIRQRLGLDAGAQQATPRPATLAPTEVLIVALGSETPVPTWTPLPSPTVAPTLTLTPTRVPPNRYRLAFSAVMEGQRRESIFTISGDGDPETQAQLTSDETRDVEPVVSPDGNWIAFISDRTGSPELYLLRADAETSAEAIPLTQLNAETLASPAWSPEGDRIAFSANLTEGNQEIYVIRVDAPTDVIRLTENTATDQEPAWSPDGQTIAFASDRAGRGYLQIYTLPSNCNTLPGGCEAHTFRLTQSQNSSMSPAWSPDGAYIAFVSNRVKASDNDIYVMRADGTDARVVTLDQYGDNGASDLDPAWSRDGQWIAFASDRARVGFQIYMASPDGTDVFQVTSEAGNALFPSWFP